jgi:hypothetical protein
LPGAEPVWELPGGPLDTPSGLGFLPPHLVKCRIPPSGGCGFGGWGVCGRG